MSPSARARERKGQFFLAFALLLTAIPLRETGPWSALWTTPAILIASVLIAWGAESAQFFVAQGFALAVLAWMQTLPEFAVEAVLAWKQQSQLLLANLTGALRLLTGLAWPIIYLTAAVVHRRRDRTPLRVIELDPHHSVEVISLIPPLCYAGFICWKGTLTIYDAIVLIAIYAAYLLMLSRLPPQAREGIEDLEAVPRAIVQAPKWTRTAAILSCFAAGGALIYFTAEPFLGSLISLATAIGIPSFLIIQWLAPVISEFPELLSTFYFARQEEKAPMALMNITSSNINQWTLLVAMLPIVLSFGHGSITTLILDGGQRVELILTVAQSAVALLFLINMRFVWWEASLLFGLFAIQFVLPKFAGEGSKLWIAGAFGLWATYEVLSVFTGRRKPEAFTSFVSVWRSHISE